MQTPWNAPTPWEVGEAQKSTTGNPYNFVHLKKGPESLTVDEMDEGVRRRTHFVLLRFAKVAPV